MSAAYREAAEVLKVVLSRKRGLRAAALAPHVKNKRKVLALVSRTLQNQGHLESAVAATRGAQKKLVAAIPNRAMRLLILYDLLLGSGKISGGGKAVRVVKELQEPLARLLAPVAKALRLAEAAAAKAQAEADASGSDLLGRARNSGGANPRYVRVNTIKTTLPTAVAELKQYLSETWKAANELKASKQQKQAATAAANGKNDKDSSSGDGSGDGNGSGDGSGDGSSSATSPTPPHPSDDELVCVDAHVSNLVACAPLKGLMFHAHPRVMDGSWVLQDKASCFSAETMAGPLSGWWGQEAEEEGSKGGNGDGGNDSFLGDVLDACAAPGNKTTHLAALLHAAKAKSTNSNTTKNSSGGTVLAFDRDPVRLHTLQERAASAGCCAKPPPLVSSSSNFQQQQHQQQQQQQHDKKKSKKQQKLTGSAAGDSAPLVVAQCCDFLAADPSAPEFKNLRAILLDPSCSGSGITASLDRLVDRAFAANAATANSEESTSGGGGGDADAKNERSEADKVAGLVKFQKAALRKAMSFPQVFLRK
jgi:16S rRNA C967 or C1407 C5-methylase (RsmB/RsmF family)